MELNQTDTLALFNKPGVGNNVSLQSGNTLVNEEAVAQ